MRRHRPEYHAWYDMWARCTNPAQGNYKHYGGRGIKVCDRWLEFVNFLADMGARPDGLTLERKDVNGDYEPSNCMWATRSQQQQNKRNSNLISWRGETLCVSEWARRLGAKRSTLALHIKQHGVDAVFDRLSN